MIEQFGICLLNYVPLRSTISHTSEMVSQLLFGETFTIEDKYTHWFKIQSSFDGYIAWVDSKQIQLISKEEYNICSLNSNHCFLIEDRNIVERAEDNSVFNLGMGSCLPLCKEGKSKIDSYTYRTAQPILSASQIAEKNHPEKSKLLLELASKWLFTPYLWGGKTIAGTDCSGFTQTLFRLCGVYLPRDVKDQVKKGTTIDFIDVANEGDLLFFENELDELVHVGIYLGNKKVIHSSGYVKIDSVDHQGIYDHAKGAYTHHLRLIKRVLQ